MLVNSLISCMFILSFLAEREDKTLLPPPTSDTNDQPIPSSELYQYQYAFYSTNIALGGVSFLVYCLCRTDARLSWMKVCRCAPTNRRRSQRSGSAGKSILVKNGNSSGNTSGRSIAENAVHSTVIPAATLKVNTNDVTKQFYLNMYCRKGVYFVIILHNRAPWTLIKH